jgi:fructose-1,6-bisphosphatase
VVALLVVAVTVAGCGGEGSPPSTTATRAASVTVTPPPKCKLSARQRRVMARLKREIVQMHKLEQPLKTVHKHGPLKLELLLNKFLLSVGVLPVDQRGDLIRMAKSSVALCQDCFDALESIEPSLQTKFGESPCKPGF